MYSEKVSTDIISSEVKTVFYKPENLNKEVIKNLIDDGLEIVIEFSEPVEIRMVLDKYNMFSGFNLYMSESDEIQFERINEMIEYPIICKPHSKNSVKIGYGVKVSYPYSKFIEGYGKQDDKNRAEELARHAYSWKDCKQISVAL